MKAYIATTGAPFGLLVLAHVARLFAEGAHILREPVFLATTAGSLGACGWAIMLITRRNDRGS